MQSYLVILLLIGAAYGQGNYVLGSSLSKEDANLEAKVAELEKKLDDLSINAKEIINNQKGTQQLILQHLQFINDLEKISEQVGQLQIDNGSQIINEGFGNITTIIDDGANRTGHALLQLQRGQEYIKGLLEELDDDQDKNKAQLTNVYNAVGQSLAEANSLILSMLGRHIELHDIARKLQASQLRIEDKLLQLDQVKSQNNDILNKLQELEDGIYQYNATQDARLTNIANSVQDVRSSNRQIFQKLCNIQTGQRNLEKLLQEGKKSQDDWSDASYIPGY